MRKISVIAIFLFAILVPDTFGQANLLNTKRYETYFGTNQRDISRQYVDVAPDDDYERFSVLGGNLTDIDTPLEFALLSYYSPPVIQIRPVEADTILPADNPRLADLKLGAALLQEIQVFRFLADTAAVSRHEGMLRFITDRSNVTRAEVEAFYRNGIRGLISEIVDEEFNKISFLLEGSPNGSYNAVLTRNTQNGHYVLSYEGYFNGNRQTKELAASSLEALSAMRNNSADFNQATINTVRAQAALIPAVVYSAAVRNNAVETIVAFYLNPSQNTFNALGVQYRTFLLNDGDRGRAASSSFLRAINELHPAIADRMLTR